MSRRRYRIILIKPSHYDDDGYVIQWWRSPIPSNSLAAVYGLLRDCADRRVLGADIDIEVEAFDETNSVLRVDRILRRLREAEVGGMIMLVGVQSNQFPRALDLGLALRQGGATVGIGGFHVSGTLAMLPELDPDVAKAQDAGIFLFAGEGEGRFDALLRDAAAGQLQPIYNFMNDLPGIEDTPIPVLPFERITRTAGATASFDAGRGCPYQCSFCTIINVQGRKSRRRSPDDIEKIIRENAAAGVHRFFITDDNFARNKDWEPIFDRMAALRAEGIRISAIIQVDTLCHKIPNFIEKAEKAGVRRVFIGLENINPDSLIGAKKRQNKITEYRSMLLAWKQHKVITYAGYILGFPNDTPDSIARDIDIIKRELPVDILEFFFLTPLPGSEDHKKLRLQGVAMDPDLNRYDLNHVCTAHPRMSKAQWEGAYRDAWRRYYDDAHIETAMKRAQACGISASKVLSLQVWFMGSLDIEGVHPLESGYFRIKVRRNRRPTFPIEPVWAFYPRYAVESGVKLARWAWLWGKHGLTCHKLRRQRDYLQRTYRDLALTPPTDDDVASLELFGSNAAKTFLAHQKHVGDLTKSAAAG